MARITASQISLMKQLFAQIGAVDSSWLVGDIPLDQLGGTTNWFTESFDARLTATLVANKIATGEQGDKADTAISRLDALQTVPPGAVVSFAMSIPPTGWLECDGSAVSREDYSDLYAAVGDSFGPGDASTTFNLPDLRGHFVRGWNHGATEDPNAAIRTAQVAGGATGDTVGSHQEDEVKSHAHVLPMRTSGNQVTVGSGQEIKAPWGVDGDGSFNSGGLETRPKNVYLMYCIKI